MRPLIFRAAALAVALVGPVQLGCVVGQVPVADDFEADAETGATEPDASHDDDAEPDAAAPATDAQAPADGADTPPEPVPDAEPPAPDEATRCAEVCQQRIDALEMSTLCVADGVSCLDACAATRDWLPEHRQRALECLASDSLCRLSVEACTVRRGPGARVPLMVNVLGTRWGVPDGYAVHVWQYAPGEALPESRASEIAPSHIEGGRFELSFPALVSETGGSATIWFDADGDAQCGEGDILRRIEFDLPGQPLLLPEEDGHPLATGVIEVEVDNWGVALDPLLEGFVESRCMRGE